MTRVVGRLATAIAAGSVALGSVALASAFLATAASASTITAAHKGPHIVAHPVSVMVGTATRLTGTGFAPNTRLTIAECSVKSWIVPQNPCVTDNQVHVRTNPLGGFSTPLTARFCPSPPPGADRAAGIAQNCFVGAIHPQDVDVIKLQGAAKITVTGP